MYEDRTQNNDSESHEEYLIHFPFPLESDVDRFELFRLTLRFFDDVSTAS